MEEKILQMLKNANGFISGQDIADCLKISRSAIWKYISLLKSKGYNIQGVSNRGYMLLDYNGIYNKYEISYFLKTENFGKNLIFYDEVDSTNDAAKRIADISKHGTAVIAEIQTNGKGRRGKTWTSQKNSGVWLSIILKPEIEPLYASRITLIAGLSVCDALNSFGNFNAVIKWPNDVLISGKKVCGILTEMSAEMDKINYIVTGMGINVNTEEFSTELKDVATSLKIEGGKDFLRAEVAARILFELEKNYNTFIKNNNLSLLIEKYKKRCVTLGKNVLVLAKEPFDGKAIEINNTGELIVEKADGTKCTVFSGEVSIKQVSGDLNEK